MRRHGNLLRVRDGKHARVTYEELFFDLVYVFAVTQLSHLLFHELDLTGAARTLVLWFAVWLGWQYSIWFTNWYDPTKPLVRGFIFLTMVPALLIAAAIPRAFEDRGLLFAVAYSVMQAGRALFAVAALPRGDPLLPNYRRILSWMLFSGIFWVAGGLSDPDLRLLLWGFAAIAEYASPMIGFWTPWLGRSETSEWSIEGGHLAERFQLFVIVALGETLLATGAELAEAEQWGWPILMAMAAAFLGTLALWWLYFATSSRDATIALTRSTDPGRMAANVQYTHTIFLFGIIVSAVGNDLVVGEPLARPNGAEALTLAAGPAIYLVGSAIYKKLVYGRYPRSHLFGAAALAVAVPVALHTDLLIGGWLTTIIMLAVAAFDLRNRECSSGAL